MSRVRQATKAVGLSLALSSASLALSQEAASAAQTPQQEIQAMNKVANNPALVSELGNTALNQLETEMNSGPVYVGYTLGFCAIMEMSKSVTSVSKSSSSNHHTSRHTKTVVKAAIVPNPVVIYATDPETGVTVSEAVGYVDHKFIRGAAAVGIAPYSIKAPVSVPELNKHDANPGASNALIEFSNQQNSIVMAGTGQPLMDGVEVQSSSLQKDADSKLATETCKTTIPVAPTTTPATSQA